MVNLNRVNQFLLLLITSSFMGKQMGTALVYMLCYTQDLKNYLVPVLTSFTMTFVTVAVNPRCGWYTCMSLSPSHILSLVNKFPQNCETAEELGCLFRILCLCPVVRVPFCFSLFLFISLVVFLSSTNFFLHLYFLSCEIFIMYQISFGF